LAVAALVAVTAGIGGFVLWPRGDHAPSGAFAVAVERFMDEAHLIERASTHVHTYHEMGDFAAEANLRIARLEREAKVFKKAARDEDGEARTIAEAAFMTSRRGIYAASVFRDALTLDSPRPAEADWARQQLENSLAELRKQLRAWKKL
jgi:hypothetical protein